MAEELIPINILIADRTYRIRTNPKDEEVVRKTVKLINDKILEFKSQFAGKDMQDYIAMVIIWYATVNAGNENTHVASSELLGQLEKMETLLDKTMNK
jgi:hypothetical protein